MEYPKKEWCLYLKNVKNGIDEDLTKYDGYIGRIEDTDVKVNDNTLVKLVDTMGYQKKRKFIGEKVFVPNKKLRLGYLSKYHLNYFNEVINEVNTKYIDGKVNKLWQLRDVFGYWNCLDAVIKNSGIVNDFIIEEIAKSAGPWTLSYNKNKTHIIYPGKAKDGRGRTWGPFNDGVEIDAYTCLKYFGIGAMEEARERTYSIVSSSKVRDMRINTVLD